MRRQNINDNCWVELTDKGEQIWAKHWNRYVDNGGIVPKAIRDAATEPDGKIRFQIWELAEIFGGSLYMGSHPLPFKDNNIWF